MCISNKAKQKKKEAEIRSEEYLNIYKYINIDIFSIFDVEVLEMYRTGINKKKKKNMIIDSDYEEKKKKRKKEITMR